MLDAVPSPVSADSFNGAARLRERRLNDRRSVNLTAQAQTLAGSVALRASNVSASGVLLSSPHVPPVGFALHLTLYLPDGPLECVATVIRALEGVGFACRITVPGTQERRRWWGFLESLPREAVLAEQSFAYDRRDWFDFEWRNADGAEPG